MNLRPFGSPPSSVPSDPQKARVSTVQRASRSSKPRVFSTLRASKPTKLRILRIQCASGPTSPPWPGGLRPPRLPRLIRSPVRPDLQEVHDRKDDQSCDRSCDSNMLIASIMLPEPQYHLSHYTLYMYIYIYMHRSTLVFLYFPI